MRFFRGNAIIRTSPDGSDSGKRDKAGPRTLVRREAGLSGKNSRPRGPVTQADPLLRSLAKPYIKDVYVCRLLRGPLTRLDGLTREIRRVLRPTRQSGSPEL